MPTKAKTRKQSATHPRRTKKLNVAQSAKLNLEPVLRTESASTEFAAREQKVRWTLCILLIMATLAIYYRAIRNPFVNYDDWGYVTENSHVQQGISRDTFRWALTATEEDNWHPLTWMSHALDCQLFGLNATGHHLTSVILHLMNAALLFFMLARVTGARWRSLLVAALFALHPINVESVAWVAERKNVLSMFFFLLSLGVYGWYARRPALSRYATVCLLFTLGLSAKPMIVTLPCVLLLMDFWPLGRVQGWSSPSPEFQVPQFRFAQLVTEKIPLFVLSAASSVVTVIAQRGAIRTNESYPFFIRLANAVYAYAMYVGKTLWPVRLGSFYPYEGETLSGWTVFLCLAILGAVTWSVWRNRSRAYLPVGWFWFLGTMIPMIGLVQVGDQAMADRYAYLPLVGLFVTIVWLLGDLLADKRLSARWAVTASGIAICALGLLTWRQIGYWASSFNLWSHALNVTTNNYMAEDYVGTALLVKAYEQQGQRYSEEALVHFQNAARINPRDPISHLNLGADLQERGQIAEAIEQYQAVLNITQDWRLTEKVYIDLGAAYHQLGDLQKSQQFYQAVLKIDPHNRTVFENLGKLGMDERIQQLSAAATANPSSKTYFQLGQVQQAAGRLVEARASYEAALSLNRDSAQVKNALAALHTQQKP